MTFHPRSVSSCRGNFYRIQVTFEQGFYGFFMIVFDLGCENGHVFEAWFKDSDNFDEQKEQGLLECPVCGSTKIRKMLSPVNVRKAVSDTGDSPVSQEALLAAVRGLYENIIKNSEDVGTAFASEALKMHYGVKEQKSIRGVATEEEEKILKDEGVEFFRIPVPKQKDETEN